MRPLAGSRRSTRPGLFSTSRSVPAGSRSIEVGSVNATGVRAAGRTCTDPRREVEPPARADERPATRARKDEARAVRPVASGRADVDPLRPRRLDADRTVERDGTHGQPRSPEAAGDDRRRLTDERDADERSGGRVERERHARQDTKGQESTRHARSDANTGREFAKEFANGRCGTMSRRPRSSVDRAAVS